MELRNDFNGDIRYFNDLEFVNVRCWKCGTTREIIEKYWIDNG